MPSWAFIHSTQSLAGKNTMKSMTVTFPLPGIWQVVTSPGNHVPSHYTDALGMTYAFDFAKPKDINIPLLSRLFSVKTMSCEGWNAEVISPIKGEVVEVQRNIADRKRLCLFIDIFFGLYPFLFLLSKKKSNIEKVFGNYVIIKNESCCCLLAHLKERSIRVKPGEIIESGHFVGRIGHNGSSQIPHLHFQLMDSPNLLKAKGIASNFNLNTKNELGKWVEMPRFVPRRHQVVQEGGR